MIYFPFNFLNSVSLYVCLKVRFNHVSWLRQDMSMK